MLRGKWVNIWVLMLLGFVQAVSTGKHQVSPLQQFQLRAPSVPEALL